MKTGHIRERIVVGVRLGTLESQRVPSRHIDRTSTMMYHVQTRVLGNRFRGTLGNQIKWRSYHDKLTHADPAELVVALPTSHMAIVAEKM